MTILIPPVEYLPDTPKMRVYRVRSVICGHWDRLEVSRSLNANDHIEAVASCRNTRCSRCHATGLRIAEGHSVIPSKRATFAFRRNGKRRTKN